MNQNTKELQVHTTENRKRNNKDSEKRRKNLLEIANKPKNITSIATLFRYAAAEWIPSPNRADYSNDKMTTSHKVLTHQPTTAYAYQKNNLQKGPFVKNQSIQPINMPQIKELSDPRDCSNTNKSHAQH